MPGYVSHTVMAQDVYDKLKKKNVSLEYMLTFSLGGDLSKYSKCRYVSHHKDMDKFIYNMADYIKNNDLIDDSEAIGLLYGHICHYVMDDTVHPLVRGISKKCLKDKHNHTLIEGYYDSYLVSTKRHTSIGKYDNNKILAGVVDKKIANIINYAYYSTYKGKHIARYYKFNIWLYRKIKYLYKIFSIKFLKKISGFNKFIDNNRDIDIFNSDHKIKYYSYQGKLINDSLLDVYDTSIDRAIKYIKDIDKYLKS